MLLLLFSASLSAQTATPNSSSTPTPPNRQVIASVSDNSIRFTSLGELIQIRLEVIAPSGEVLFDSGFKRANLIDWSASDKQGRRVADGSYLCVVTVRDASGAVTRRYAIGSLRDLSLRLNRSDDSLLTAAQVQATGPASGEDSMTIIDPGDSPAAVVLAHDGTTAHLVSGSGGLSISSGDFFANKLVEHIRLTAEGNVGIGVANPQAKLDVAGLIRASQGVIFPDGTVQYSASSKTLGAKSSRSSQKPGKPGSGDDFEVQSITQGRIVKFGDNAGTLADSIILETSGRLGIGTISPDSLLNVQGVIPSLLGHLSVIRATGSFNGFGLLMDATGTGNNNLGLAIAGVPKASFAWDNARNFFGMANFVFSANDFSLRLNADGSLTYHDGVTSAERFRVTAAGRVGIGTASPAASLDVVGNINSSTQFNIGGVRVLIAGSSNTFVGENTSFVNTGAFNSFFGNSAGRNNSAGFANTFIGQSAGLSNNAGSNNTFVGTSAGTRNTANSENTFMGSSAGLSNGDNDPNTLANFNTFVGNVAGLANQTGANNSFFGNDSGFGNVGGNDNTFIGVHTGFASGIASGSNNTLLGASSLLESAAITNATAIGSRAVVNQSNSMVLGSITGTNGATSDVKVGIGTNMPDRHLHIAGPGDQEIDPNVGSLAPIAVEAPKNLTIAVLDNERFGETGMQKTPTASGVDLAAIAVACGIRTSRIVRTMAEVTELRDLAHGGRGTAFAQIKINPEALPFVMPPADGVILTTRFRQSVLGDEALFN
jgi:hypothetical protein